MPRHLAPVLTALLLIGCAEQVVEPPVEAPSTSKALGAERAHFWLTVLHNNDGESDLIDAGSGLEDFGGVARFATVVDALRREALESPFPTDFAEPLGAPPAGRGDPLGRRGVVLVSSGDNFLAGAEFNASLQKGVPFYDGIAMDLIGYDASAIGNHEFDFGPDVLADFIESFPLTKLPFVSANLEFSGEPRLQALQGQGRIAGSIVVETRGQLVGVVGATTTNLSFISSPRNVGVMAVAPAIQAEVNALEAAGVSIIVLISHLQSINEDLDLIPHLRGVDIAVAGGGDELLANPGDRLVPGEGGQVFGPYPIWATDADGVGVPIITTRGGYRYVGRLIAGFDRSGNLLEVDEVSGPVRVAGGAQPDAVQPDPEVQAQVVEPVEAAVAALEANIIGVTEVTLDGVRGNVRTVETNEGDLIADALLWQAAELAADFGAPVPDVALQNGGGIRNDSEIAAGTDISEKLTFDILPIANCVTIVPDIPRSQFKEILENAVSQVENVSGRFAQVAGFAFEWDPNGTAQTLDSSGNVVTSGTRVRTVILNPGTPQEETIVSNGDVVAGADLTIATIDFLARGGDQYPYRDAPFTSVGVTYQQALANYIVDGLGGLITAADYPEGGEGRIIRSAAPMMVATP